MTNPPSGGSVSPPSLPGAGTATSPDSHVAPGGPPGDDFGATTLSGRTMTEQPGRADNRPAGERPTERPATERPAGSTRADLPPVPQGLPGGPGGPVGPGGPGAQP